MAEAHEWQRTSPMAVLFFLGRIAKALVQNAWQALAPVAALLFAYQGELMSKLTAAVVVVLVGSLVVAMLRYWFFCFRITDEAVLIRDGVLQKKRLDIKFARIQGINTEQNLIYRYLGLVTVSFDTAGSSGDEGVLPAVPVQIADRLNQRLTHEPTEALADADDTATRAGAPLLQLTWRDMLRIGLSDRRALIVLAVLGPLFERLGDRGERIVAAYANRAVAWFDKADLSTGVLMVLTAVLATALLLATVSIIAAFLRYYRFVFTSQRGRLQTVGGLLTRHTNTMDVVKLQMLDLSQGMLLRLFGRWRAVLHQATSSGRERDSKSLTLPVLEPDFVTTLTQIAFAPELQDLDCDPRSARFTRISAYYLRPRLLWFGVLPAVIAITLAWRDAGAAALILLLWLPFVALICFVVWRRYGFQLSEDGMILRSGFIGYSLELFPFRKVQQVTVSQTWFQRRRGLAGIRLYLASGSVVVPYIEQELAWQLRDHVLYCVESSERSWH